METWNKLNNKAFYNWLNQATLKDVDELLLSGKTLFDIDAKTIAQQWYGRKALLKKAPELAEKTGIVYPRKQYLEQCSSAQSCSAKAQIFKELEVTSVVDITGGWGIDAYYLSKMVTYTHIERNEDLQQMAAHNFKLLESSAQSVNGNGLDYLQNASAFFGWIYADPQRRTEQNVRTDSFLDHEPNPTELLETLAKTNAKGAIIKMSPMVDISVLKKVTPTGFYSAFVVIEVVPEVKEILWIVAKNPIPFQEKVLLVQGEQVHSFQENGETLVDLLSSTSEFSFLHIPRSGIIKAQFSDQIAASLQMQKAAKDCWVYATKNYIENAAFRSFKIEEELPANAKKLKSKIAKQKLHVISKSYPKTANEISAMYRLIPGGNRYLLCLKIEENYRVFLTSLSVPSIQKTQ